MNPRLTARLDKIARCRGDAPPMVVTPRKGETEMETERRAAAIGARVIAPAVCLTAEQWLAEHAPERTDQ
jgi:hypothetical protein